MTVLALVKDLMVVDVASAVSVVAGFECHLGNDTNASIAVGPETGAVAASRGVPSFKLGSGDAVSVRNGVAELALLGIIKLVAVVNDDALGRQRGVDAARRFVSIVSCSWPTSQKSDLPIWRRGGCWPDEVVVVAPGT